MRDPEITFKVEDKNIIPTSYLNDYVGEYQSYEEIKESPKLLLEIKEFFNDWLKNITEQFKNAIENLRNKNIEPTKLEELKEEYMQGDLVRLEHMENEDLPIGSIGFVKKVDDMGQVHVLWQNGSSLALNVNVDKFQKIEIKNLPLKQQFSIGRLKEKLFKNTEMKEKLEQNINRKI